MKSSIEFIRRSWPKIRTSSCSKVCFLVFDIRSKAAAVLILRKGNDDPFYAVEPKRIILIGCSVLIRKPINILHVGKSIHSPRPKKVPLVQSYLFFITLLSTLIFTMTFQSSWNLLFGIIHDYLFNGCKSIKIQILGRGGKSYFFVSWGSKFLVTPPHQHIKKRQSTTCLRFYWKLILRRSVLIQLQNWLTISLLLKL